MGKSLRLSRANWSLKITRTVFTVDGKSWAQQESGLLIWQNFWVKQLEQMAQDFQPSQEPLSDYSSSPEKIISVSNITHSIGLKICAFNNRRSFTLLIIFQK